MMQTPSPWSQSMIELLRQLWDDGVPTQEIGRRIGMSKNAVIGKARRIGLDGRQSPIKRDYPKKAQPPKAVRTKPTLPRLPSVQKVVEMPRARTPQPMPLFDRPEFQERVVDLGARAPVAPVSVPKVSAHSTCQFPTWTDTTPRAERRFCGAPALFGKSWCSGCYHVVFKRMPVAEAA